MAGAVKISHIPYGFFEKQMWKYFTQFGRIQRLKLFRSKITGNSKGFAFVQFAHEGVAKIVSETMNNYLMFDKILKCEFIPESKIQPSMFKNWRRVMIPKLGEKRHTRKVNSFKNDDQELKSHRRLYKKLVKKNEECSRLGIDYQFDIPPLPKSKSRKALKSEIKEEQDDIDAADSSTCYSLIVDTSDDEIEFKTPPCAVKKTKRTKRHHTAV